MSSVMERNSFSRKLSSAVSAQYCRMIASRASDDGTCIRQHTHSIRQHTPAYVGAVLQGASVSIRRHTSAQYCRALACRERQRRRRLRVEASVRGLVSPV
jgi:hypothetical protein